MEVDDQSQSYVLHELTMDLRGRQEGKGGEEELVNKKNPEREEGRT